MFQDDVLAVALKGPHLVSASADGTIKVMFATKETFSTSIDTMNIVDLE